MLRLFLDAFWSECAWLPANTTWEDVANAPHKAVTYAEPKDLFAQVPLTLTLIVVRYTLEKFCFKPIGRLLGVKCTKQKNASFNPVLEVAFQSSVRLKDMRALAKKLDMTERQVERWWRFRRRHNKLSTLIKFCENMWRGLFYLSIFLYGLFILWDKEWLWNIDYWHIGYPHQGITNDIWWYYMVSTSFYWSLTISQFWDVRRKDFRQMFVHHIVTIALLSFSWVCNLHRIGTLVLLLHDCADILLELGKAAKYAHFNRLANCLLFTFMIVWIITRIVIYPYHILLSTSYWVLVSPAIFALNVLLWVLLILHIVWTWHIILTAYKALDAGQFAGDIRSSSSDLSDSSHELNNNISLKHMRTLNNKMLSKSANNFIITSKDC